MKKTKIATSTGEVVEGVEVPVEVSNERWSELTLEDGSVIRIKAVVLSVVRVEGRYDQDGNPMYVVKSGITTAVASAPETLRKKSH